MRRSRCGFENGRSWFGSFLVSVITVKGGEIDGEALQYGVSNAGLISGQVFILKVWIAHLPDQDRRATRPHESPEVQTLGNIQTSRGASSSRYRCPEHFMVTRLPRDAGTRQQNKPGVVIMFQLCAYCEIEPVR